MSRFFWATFIMAVVAFIASNINALPWWGIGVVCFVVALNFKLSSGKAFLAGFVAIFFLWMGIALVTDYFNQHILSTRMASLFTLNNPYLFMGVAALIGGLVGGMSAWSAALLRVAFQKNESK